MTPLGTQDNIVKKVFERSKQERVSPLFTHYRDPLKAKKAAKASKTSRSQADLQPRRLPAAFDLGGSRIKLLQLMQDTQGGLEVVAMDEELCEQETALNPLFKSKQALERLIGRNPVGPNVVVGLPAKDTRTFNFTFPSMSEDDLKEAVRWKIRQLKPFETADDQVRFAILKWALNGHANGTTTSTQQRVTVVCVSLESISQATSLLGEVGLKAVSVHVSPLAMMNIRRFRTVARNSDEVILWLDLGAEESVFVIEKRGVVYYMRNLSVTGKNLTKQLATTLKLSEADAEALKQRHGLEYWTPETQPGLLSEEEKQANPSAAVCAALVSTLENLVTDIELAFKHFSYQVAQSQIQKFDRVVLAGGGANLKQIDRFLSDRLAVPVEKVDPFASLRLSAQLRGQREDVGSAALVFAAAAGLAISPLIDKESVVDFLETEKRTPAAKAKRFKLAFTPKTVGALAMVGAAFLIAPQFGSLMYHKKQAEASAAQVKAAREELSRRQTNQLELAQQEKQLLERKQSMDNKMQMFKEAGAEQVKFSEVLVKLAALMPKEIWITKLYYAQKKLTLVGSTGSNEHVVSFLDNLKKPEEFSDVTFDYTQRDPESASYSFEIMLQVK